MNAALSSSLTSRPAWAALAEHFEQVRHEHLRQLFADDPGRGGRMVVEAAGLYMDFSKHRITDETLRLLMALAEECGLPGQHRRDVRRRADQRHGATAGAACRTAGPEGRATACGRR